MGIRIRLLRPELVLGISLLRLMQFLGYSCLFCLIYIQLLLHVYHMRVNKIITKVQFRIMVRSLCHSYGYSLLLVFALLGFGNPVRFSG